MVKIPKSPELSRRGFLIATGTLGALTGVALASCGKEHGGASENTEEAAEKFKFNKADFEGWENKTPEEQLEVYEQWFESIGANKELMPEYREGKDSHEYVAKLAGWLMRNRYQPLREAYHSSEENEVYADLLARDVLTCGGKNTMSGIGNSIYEAICDEKDIFTSKDLPTGDPYELCGTTDVMYFYNDPNNPNETNPGCVVVYKQRVDDSFSMYLWTEYRIKKNENGRHSICVVQSMTSLDANLGSDITLYDVNSSNIKI